MADNLRFSTAIEALALMATEPEKAHTSHTLAGALATNPVVVRRLLAQLARAELVTTSKGPAGGYRLARSPKQISLRDIYRALGAEELLHQTSHGLPDTQELRRTIHGAFRKAQKAMEQDLNSVTLNQIVKKTDKRANKHGRQSHEDAAPADGQENSGGKSLKISQRVPTSSGLRAEP